VVGVGWLPGAGGGVAGVGTLNASGGAVDAALRFVPLDRTTLWASAWSGALSAMGHIRCVMRNRGNSEVMFFPVAFLINDKCFNWYLEY
jgi:hypothetical protein